MGNFCQDFSKISFMIFQRAKCFMIVKGQYSWISPENSKYYLLPENFPTTFPKVSRAFLISFPKIFTFFLKKYIRRIHFEDFFWNPKKTSWYIFSKIFIHLIIELLRRILHPYICPNISFLKIISEDYSRNCPKAFSRNFTKT